MQEEKSILAKKNLLSVKSSTEAHADPQNPPVPSQYKHNLHLHISHQHIHILYLQKLDHNKITNINFQGLYKNQFTT